MSLGRGLSALITSTGPRKKITYSTGSETSSSDSKIWMVPANEISPSPHQPRRNFSDAELGELADSIREHGILQPLLAAEKEDGGYELIAGERRLRASKLAGLTAVPVIVKKLAEQKKLEVALIENIQRQDLNAVEEAFAYKRLMEEFGLTQEEVAGKVGKSRPAIANTIRLLELPAEAQAALAEGKISAGQGRALLGIGDQKQQLEILASMLGQKITVRELEKNIREKSGRTARKDPNLTYLENKLRERLGTKVAITERGGRGTVIIDYYSKEELAALIKKISGE